MVDKGKIQTWTHIVTYFRPMGFIGELLNITQRSICIQIHVVVVTIFVLITVVVASVMVAIHVQEGTRPLEDRVYVCMYHVPSCIL